MSRKNVLYLLFVPVALLVLAGCSSGTTLSHTPVTVVASPRTSAATNTCFINPAAPGIPAVYAGSAIPASGPMTAPAVKGTPVILQGGLEYVDIKVGSGSAAKNGSNITVNYTGWLASTCQKFDSSYDAHSGQGTQPFSTVLGQGQVIKGWDEGLIGMQVGGIRRLYLPAALAYGAQGAGTIPPDADLIFDVQMVSLT